MPADLIIGVDFGMTFTGVAYYVPNKTDPEIPKLFQKWPGKNNKVENKVPTSLIYHEDKLISWGFLCDTEDLEDYPGFLQHQNFKLWLDQEHLKKVFPELANSPSSRDVISHEQVKRWFTDFLDRLYQHIADDFSHSPFKEEWDRKVDFVFSVPTTWKSQNVLATFKQCIKQAGFKKGGKKHNFFIGLTEAEAAAIYTLKGKALKVNPGEIILVCDAGGGTTDTALLEAIHHDREEPQLKQLGVDCGKYVGSTNIDIAFQSLIKRRLTKIKVPPAEAAHDPDWAHNIAWEMTRGAFQDFKCGFGTLEGTHNTFKIEIPRLPRGKSVPEASISFPEAGIEKRKMKFARMDLQNIFEEQLKGIYSTLDDQLDYMKKNKPGKQVNYLVLSGGLGSSMYIQKEVIKRYIGKSERYPNARALKVFATDNPQTAVVQGLVVNQAQQHDSGFSVMKSRTSPASYGVISKKIYNPNEHYGMDTEVDEVDNETYAMDLIRWVVKKGDSVSSKKEMTYDFERRLKSNDDPHRGNWESQVVICWKDRAFLPKSVNEDTPLLCTLVSDTSRLEVKDFDCVQFGFLWHKSYYIARYEVKLKIDVADLTFEVWCNGKKLSKNKRVRVEWKEGAEMTRPIKAEKVKDIW